MACSVLFPALYGALFPDESEAAFSNYRLWESFGFILAFAYSSHLCTVTKLYILVFFLVIGISLYGVTEYSERNKLDAARKTSFVDDKDISAMTSL